MPTIAQLFDLTGKAAIVTGGSRGLGLEIAEGLAEAGARLMICARREEWLTPAVEDLTRRGFAVEARRCDVVNAADVQTVVDQTIAMFGAVDILVNGAGVSWGAEPETMPLDKWRGVIDINLTGAFLFCQAAGRVMIERGFGRIINVASIAGLRTEVHGPHYAGYAASKAGLLGLTRELAGSWGRYGIRVNAIAPGFFRSRMTEAVIERAEADLKQTAPLARIGAAGELKGVAVFLAADASNYMTGQVLVVDGGRNIA
jgi:gluconate 5-dehydrogenase